MLYNIIVHSLACEIRRVVKDVANDDRKEKKGRENLSGINIGIWRVDAWRTASSHHGNVQASTWLTLFDLFWYKTLSAGWRTWHFRKSRIRFLGTAVLLRVSARNRGAVVMPAGCVRATFQTNKRWKVAGGGRTTRARVPKQENCRWARATTEFGAVLSVRKFREARNASASYLFGVHRPTSA